MKDIDEDKEVLPSKPKMETMRDFEMYQMFGDPEGEDYHDEARGVHSGWCRGCKKIKHTLSNDDGWCGDCN